MKSSLMWIENKDDKDDEMRGNNYECMITYVEKVKIVENKISCSVDVIKTENSVNKKKLSLCCLMKDWY